MAVMYVDARQEGIESLQPGGEVALKFVVANNVVIIGDAVSHWDLALVALRQKNRFHAEPLTPDLVRHLVALHHISSCGKIASDGAVAFSTDSCYADFGLIPDKSECGRVKEAIRLALSHVPPAITWPTWRDATARA